MSRDPSVSRRGFLAGSAAAGTLAASVPAAASVRKRVAASPEEERLRRLCRTLAGGAPRTAAAAWEDEPVDVLCRRATGRDLAALRSLSDGEILAAIDAETRRTFRDGEVTQVGGWVLSRAEAAVYRLAAL